MRVRLVVLTLALLALPACSNRERANPLDPGNPVTGGRPAGFNALAAFATVQLTWDPRPQGGIDGFLLERQAPGEADYTPLGDVLAPTLSQYLDGAVQNGLRYRYRLRFVVGGAPISNAATDEATPGALRPFVVEQGDGVSDAGALTRLSTDARDVFVRYTDVREPTNLTVDGPAGLVWVSQQFRGHVQIWSTSGFLQADLDLPGSPGALAVDPASHEAWVCDLSGALRRFASDGGPGTPSRIEPLATPLGVAVRPTTRTAWVCERDGQRLRRFAGDGTPLGVTYVQFPSRVAVDSTTGEAWVTSFTAARVYRVGNSGTPVDSFSVAAGPIGITVDSRRGLVWVADALGDQVLVLDRTDGHVVQRFTGVTEAWDVAVEKATGEAWLVSRARGEVWRVNAAGVVLDRVGGLVSPLEVRLGD